MLSRVLLGLSRNLLSQIAPAAGVIARVSAAVSKSLLVAVTAELAKESVVPDSPPVSEHDFEDCAAYSVKPEPSSEGIAESEPSSVATRAHLLGRAARRKLSGTADLVPRSSARQPPGANRVWVVIRPARRFEQRGASFSTCSAANRPVSATVEKQFPFAADTIFHGFSTVKEAEIYWREVFGRELGRWM